VVRCRTCDRRVRIPSRDCCAPTPSQSAIPPGSVNEYQRKLGSKRAYHAMHYPRIRGLAATAGVRLRANETVICAALWALEARKGLYFTFLINWVILFSIVYYDEFYCNFMFLLVFYYIFPSLCIYVFIYIFYISFYQATCGVRYLATTLVYYTKLWLPCAKMDFSRKVIHMALWENIISPQDHLAFYLAPRYLTDHLIPASDAAPRCLRLRSANLNRLTVPCCWQHVLLSGFLSRWPDCLELVARWT